MESVEYACWSAASASKYRSTRRISLSEGLRRSATTVRSQAWPRSVEPISVFIRASARCWATRTAPAVLPTASAVSGTHADDDTQDQDFALLLGSTASNRFIRAAASASMANCSGPSSVDGRSGRSSVASARLRPAARCASATQERQCRTQMPGTAVPDPCTAAAP